MISAFLHGALHFLFLDLSGAALLILSNREELKGSARSSQLLLSDKGNQEEFALSAFEMTAVMFRRSTIS